MIINALLLVEPVGHMDPHISHWVTKPDLLPRDFELATDQFEFDPSTY